MRSRSRPAGPGWGSHLLHGLGADGHDFEPIVPELELAKPVRFVFPHAPIPRVTINQGMRMRAWYDILQFGGGPEDEAGLARLAAAHRGIDPRPGPAGQSHRPRRLLAGRRDFVLLTGLRYSRAPRGRDGALHLFAAGGHARRGALGAEPRDADLHGARPLRRADSPAARAGFARLLQKLGYAVEWHDYPMPHSVCAPEIADISAFLSRVL